MKQALVAYCAGLLSLWSLPASANIVVGSIWENASGAGDATPANVPATPANVTFEAPSTPLSFASGNAYTIGEFLASGGASAITYAGGASATDTLDNTLFNFTGTVSVTNGETFTVGHDDGLTLVIGGQTVISEPGPTAYVVTTETYTGPTGDFAFQLVYGECCGAPADLSISLPLTTQVPEPASLLFLGGGFGTLLLLRRRQGPALS
jgi:hypothetical protein